MQTTTIGSLTTSVLGMGCWPIAAYADDLDDGQAQRTVHAALDAGIRLFDTARAYCPGGRNGFGERQLAEALLAWKGDRDDVVVATKVVSYRDADGAWRRDGTPGTVHAWAREACANLGTNHLDLLQSHAVDPEVPFAETVGAMAELREQGLVREVGISNVTAAQVREAAEVTDLATVQNETNPDRVDHDVLAACDELGLTYFPYSPFGGVSGAEDLGQRHPALATVAERRDVNPHRVCLAWLRSLSPVVVPIPAATRPATIRDSAAAADLALTDDDLAELEHLGRGGRDRQ
jgi:aryl-alcohol dehydrogenase-like predicted oxidoreductase